MTMEQFNPFPINKYIGDKYFCNRDLELNSISSSLENGRNATIFSLRKMGKTGLISHLFAQKKEINSKYFDILYTKNELEFTAILIKHILPAIESKPEKLIRWAKNIFSKINPTIEFDTITGQPAVNFKLNDNDSGIQSLDELFAFLKNWDGELWIAIDEFQQIVQYPESGLEARLSSWIQFCPSIKWIFSGSQEDMLVSMFSDYGRAFYQSADLLKLEPISKQEYIPFIMEHMKEGKRMVDETVISSWYDKLKGHTYYVQYAMNHLYAVKPKNWNSRKYEEFFKEIIFRQEPYFVTYKNLLTSLQWKILEAVAQEGYVEKVQSKDWLMRHKLGTPSSVSAAIKLLNKRELLAFDQQGYRLMNPLMEQWLKHIKT
jgi:hypothetical protein